MQLQVGCGKHRAVGSQSWEGCAMCPQRKWWQTQELAVMKRGFSFCAGPHLCLASHDARRRRLPQPQRLLQVARGQHACVQRPPLLAALPQEAAGTWSKVIGMCKVEALCGTHVWGLAVEGYAGGTSVVRRGCAEPASRMSGHCLTHREASVLHMGRIDRVGGRPTKRSMRRSCASETCPQNRLGTGPFVPEPDPPPPPVLWLLLLLPWP